MSKHEKPRDETQPQAPEAWFDESAIEAAANPPQAPASWFGGTERAAADPRQAPEVWFPEQ
ncbi:hypothetical protein AXK56_22585 [Tsukamurella pulmonis]|uniref:Uncharacterized protein n=1 Tax=Tsukamurella pulmonis TaxID=47312 RepID=A0A1H1AD72_9ACTN|nr:hypothetical protein [Tsukamurella pulmonis]KXO92795.1 hypothetical protein AXK56_22585 [Tsukamurella pulmonis]SDQ37665.1 hypothetical protein SAMN04489765_0170 [Tsukamurella pulmonis]SUQ39366.1 Uncharacterised protein [Tsukamurella pulmonis]